MSTWQNSSISDVRVHNQTAKSVNDFCFVHYVFHIAINAKQYTALTATEKGVTDEHYDIKHLYTSPSLTKRTQPVIFIKLQTNKKQ